MKKIVLPLVLVLSLVFVGCGTSVRGEGDAVSHDVTVGTFTSIAVGGVFRVNFTQSNEVSARIEVQENLFEHMDFSITNGVLRIQTRSGVRINFRDTTPTVHLTAPSLASVSVGGNGWVTLLGNAQNFIIVASGNARVDGLGMVANAVGLTASGNAQVYIRAENTLSGLASGNARVRYSGNPVVSVATISNATVRGHG